MRRGALLLLLALCIVVAACSTAAFDVDLGSRLPAVSPEPTGADPYGTGVDGDLEVSGVATLNTCLRPTVAATLGSSIAFGASTPFHVGRLVLVWQVRGVATSAGQFDLVRVLSTSGNLVTAPLEHAYANDNKTRTLVCTVPEFENLTVLSGGRLEASPWTGNTNGVLAFLVNGTLTLDGSEIIADDAGFVGGACTRNTDPTPAGPEDAANGGFKGEGFAGDGDQGRRRDANGGGGGNPVRAGGGGGGSFAAGGDAGGTPDVATNTFGEGGAAVPASASTLHLGGAGGGGHASQGTPANPGNCSGRNGGGVVFFQARIATGLGGSIRSNGGAHVDAEDPGLGTSGGGGGAGGTVWAVVGTGDTFHPSVETLGGSGGKGDETLPAVGGAGGGGGGSGGRAKLQGFQPSSIDASGGAGGVARTTGLPGGDGGAF